MKLLKIILVLFMFSIFTTNVSAKDCDKIKQNIVAKMFCKSNISEFSLNKGSNESSSTNETSSDGEAGWKIWKKPKWMKKKN